MQASHVYIKSNVINDTVLRISFLSLQVNYYYFEVKKANRIFFVFINLNRKSLKKLIIAFLAARDSIKFELSRYVTDSTNPVKKGAHDISKLFCIAEAKTIQHSSNKLFNIRYL